MDLHARTMSACLLDQPGELRRHRHMPASPEPLLQAIAPSRDEMVVAVEGLFTWSGLADRWAQAGRPVVLGHALDMPALPGGQAQNDTIDAQKSAVLLRGGRLPQAYVSPPAMRATRALRRRRRPWMRHRAERLTPRQHTTRPSHLPERGQKSADTANRDGVAEQVADPAVQKRIDVDLTLMAHDDRRRRALDLIILKTAKPPDAHTRDLLRTVPGLGALLRLVLRDESHDLHRFPRGQDVVSSWRLGNCAKASAGKRYGPSGTTMGQADLQGAFAAAAGLCVRAHPAGQTSLTRLEKTPAQGQALTGLAHKCARAVYDM